MCLCCRSWLPLLFTLRRFLVYLKVPCLWVKQLCFSTWVRMVLATHALLPFSDHVGPSDVCCMDRVFLELNETLHTSQILSLHSGWPGWPLSMPSVLETGENPSSAGGQSEFHPLSYPFQIHEKEEEEFNEKSEHDSGINEEPLLTADQVWMCLGFWDF